MFEKKNQNFNDYLCNGKGFVACIVMWQQKESNMCPRVMCNIHIISKIFRHLSLSFCSRINLYAAIVEYKYAAKHFLYVIGNDA